MAVALHARAYSMAETLQPLITKDKSIQPPFQTEVGAWIFNISLVLFLASIVFFGGLFLYHRSLTNNQADWEKQVQTQEADLRPDLLGQLIELSNEMSAAKGLLAGHTYTSNVFSFLEATTLPKVQYTTFGFSTAALKIDVSAVAASYQTVADQIRILEAHAQVTKVEFGGLARSGDGLVSFRLTILVKPSLLKLQP